MVDDGIRIWVGNKKVVESWKLNDSNSYEGNIELTAGQYYDLRIDYFNDMMGGELELYWQRPDKRNPVLDRFARNGEPVPAQYFFQNPDPNRLTLIKTPAKPVAAPPAVVVSKTPRIIPPKRQSVAVPKPVLNPPVVKRAVTVDTIKPSLPSVRQLIAEPLADLKPGATFILHHVQFEQSSYTLLPESSAELNQLITVLKKNLEWHVEVSGHTDNVGDPRLNLALSENRAKVVANYLTRRGISDDRIIPKGFGGTRPVTGNSTEIERAKNRRVEITIN
jgi:outer membrane protein OmpA-like peptidoglycan-associated protein